MQERLDALQLYLSDECDHCAWIEESLPEVAHKIDVDIWDCKEFTNYPGLYRAINREDGSERLVSLRGIPCLKERKPKVDRYGGKLIRERLGISRKIFLA